jgi:hypothetical protein
MPLQLPKKVLIVMTFSAVMVILFFGLRFKDFSFANNVRWIGGGVGIRTGKYGIAYNADLQGFRDANGTDGFTLVLAARALPGARIAFKSLVMLHDGSDEAQLMIGQWKNTMIVMNGNDYDNSQRTPKLIVKDGLAPDRVRLFTIVASSLHGTAVYVDGVPVMRRKGVILKIPFEGKTLQLVLGNSVYGNQSWDGDLLGLALYADVLSKQAVRGIYRQWTERGLLEADRRHGLLIAYAFDEQGGYSVNDKSGSGNELTIPKVMVGLRRPWLATMWYRYKLDTPAIIEIVLNIVGFAPLGIVLFPLLAGTNRRRLVVCVFVIGICLSLSLFIETGQAWLPSRNSSAFDVILNTLGGAIGALSGGRILKMR